MIYRTYDPVLVAYALETYDETPLGLDISDWLMYNTNVALADEHGNVALFERQARLPSSVCGHYFFHSRGRAAINAAEGFLKEIFTGPYDVQTIIGLTPVEHKGANWMNRKLGFKQHDTIDTEVGPCGFFLLTKNTWLQREEV